MIHILLAALLTTISTAPLAESGGTFSPDGNEFYFTVRTPTTTTRPLSVICVSRRVRGRWTRPRVAEFSGRYWDTSAAMSPDGTRLFFASTRHDEPGRSDTDIWVVERKGDHWSEARNIGEPVNTSADEHSPSVAADGTLYFASTRPGGKGSTDLYRSRWRDGKFQPPENLEDVNSDAAELTPFITPDQHVLLFAAIGRPDMRLAGGRPYARADLYYSLSVDGRWSTPQQFSPPINTVANEIAPVVSRDGTKLYFTSERQPFAVPVARGLTMDSLNRQWRSIENGLSNIYVIELPDLAGKGAHPPARR